MTEKVHIDWDGRSYEAAGIEGTEREQAIDVTGLRSATGLITYDPGYANTGACKSAITFIDGEAGVLRYRGYPIEQLAERSSFIETSYLLIYGELPTQEELEHFQDRIKYHTMLREDMRHFFSAFPRDAHPMAILSAATSALSTFYQDHYDPLVPEDVEVTTYRLMAKLPTVAAWSYKTSVGHPYVYPRNDLGYVENFIHMMFAVPAEPYEVDPDVAKLLKMLFILHADHEQNCSASTVRLVGSSYTNMYAAMSAAIAALWGPRHGGANQEVIEMLVEIRDGEGDTQHFVQRAKDRNDPFRLMGFGHRVYKNYDPRARIIKAAADRVIGKIADDDPLFEIARELEEVALSDDYFIERKLYPNVDFYSGLVYRAMGLPLDMYPVLFALGRLPGWIAQWREMMGDPDSRLGRPRQIYVGSPERDYVPMHDRA